jgi:hypothetical protein
VPYRRHRHQEFLRFLKLIDAAVPKDLDLHLVLDNYATHRTPAIHQWLVRRADQPETAPLSAPQRHRAGDRYPPFAWTKTADEILQTLAAYCRRVSSPGR